MDANLVARELEMTLLAKLLENRHVDASSNITMPTAALLHLLRTYLGPGVSMHDLQAAIKVSPLLAQSSYSREIEVDDVRSDQGVTLTVFRWNKFATSAAPYRKLLNEHGERPRPPIAATNFRGGPLGLNPVPFEVRNEGYGTQADVVLEGVSAPDWITVAWQGNKGTLAASPAQGGVYRGEVVISSNANDIRLPVSAESAAFVFPARNELTLDELIPTHPDIDRDATERLLEQVLTSLKFERLPGGLFIKRGTVSVSQRSNDWWLTETEILTGGLVGTGYPATFTVYADADGKVDKYTETVIAEHGQLGGGLADLFEYLDVQVGQRLTLEPYRGGYKVKLSPAEPWRTARGHTYWLQGAVNTVLQHRDVLDVLVQRTEDRNITVNLLLSGEQSLPDDLVRQHRSGRLTIRFTPTHLPYRLIVCDEDCAAFVPPHGSLQRPANPPQTLWEGSSALEGRDYRELAWQRGKRGEDSDEWGLLDLELSVAMEKLAQALRPATVKAVSITERQRHRLLVDLPGQARRLGVHVKPLLAAPILERLGLTPEQVNANGLGVRVTAGGYLVVRPQDLNGQRDCARYIANLYGGVIHHSQLRKLVEVFSGQSYESTSFVTASLHDLGWAGNGYRRPRQAWEPNTRELPTFTAEVLAHFDSRSEAMHWLRRNVAASEAQLERALAKAVAIAGQFNEASAPVVARAVPVPKAPIEAKPVIQAPSSQVTAPTRKAAAPTLPALKPKVSFAPLVKSDIALPDPRFAPFHAVQRGVTELISQEGPMPETWLVRRYAAQTRCNPRQVQAVVLEAARHSTERGDIQRIEFPCGHVEYFVSGQKATLRERGERYAEDIPFGEWCELLHALNLTTTSCDDVVAHREATAAFRFGADARRVQPLLSLALEAARKSIA
ncbi:hypothetical protein ACINK0_07095 [Deinococcus sp. VB343]|uniref:Uncharacterized protein n=1 Tax=Deinococcus sp. VB142 TaxID=3112952 RepID=A0AAU6Q6B6_9DEIO